jgi:hypothetical protein
MRLTLPKTLTPAVNLKSQCICGVRANPVFPQWVKMAFDYNKTNKPSSPLAINVYVFPQQCKNNALQKFGSLGSQMMFVPAEALGKIRIPETEVRFKDIERIFVRIELYVTQEEDVKGADMRILDPEARLPYQEQDVKTLINRTHRETGISKEVLLSIAEKALSDPEKAIRTISSEMDLQGLSEFEGRMTRVCVTCNKYGYTLPKRSVCKKAYYCSEECQTKDWKSHRKLVNNRGSLPNVFSRRIWPISDPQLYNQCGRTRVVKRVGQRGVEHKSVA